MQKLVLRLLEACAKRAYKPRQIAVFE